MKFITKSLLTLALLLGAVGVVNAGEKVYATFENPSNTNTTWNAATKTFTWSTTYYNQLRNIGLPTSGLGAYTKLVIKCTINAGDKFRILVYKGSDNQTLWVEQSGETTLDLTTIPTDFLAAATEICLSGSNQAAPGEVVVDYVYLEKGDDPLFAFKDALQKAINVGKMQSQNFKTNLSWNALQDAITAGEAALAKTNVTEEELTAAAAAVNNAISGLKLFEGYTQLTAADFKHYESLAAPGEGAATGCAYELNAASGLPYGDGNVGELNWADLAGYDKLVVITSGDIKPRFCMNRLEANGQQAETQADSKMLDINPNNAFTWSTEKYQTIDGNIFSIDLKKIVADYGFARLHSIKKQGWGAGVVVTDLLLYKAPEATTDDPAIMVNKLSLQAAVDKAEAIDLSTKTSESAKKVKDAVVAAKDLLAMSAPSIAAMEAARRAILQAIDELVDAPVIADGVYDLTQAMFQEWTGIDEEAEPTEATIGCAYEVGTGEKGAGTTMYGNPSVVWKTYADLSAYDHLLIVGTPGLQLRVLFNRLEVGNGGGDGNGGALTELNPTIGEDGLVDIDLKAENLNGAARLNAIKLGWGSPAGQFTKLQVVKGAYDPVAVGLQAVKTGTENGAIFNLGGQRLAQPKKGLNIINGKKVVIK
jgi:hypothetical protein